MSKYNPTQWVDHVVDDATGEVIQQGTAISAANLNHMEQGIAALSDNVENLVPASQEQAGITKLSNAIDSDSETTAATPKAVKAATLQAKSYTDDQISLVTATGIPKLVSYPLQVVATEDNQTTFEIPLDTFEVATDTLLVVINRAFLDASQYTVKAANRDEAGELVKRAELELAKGVNIGSKISLVVLKNVPIGADGSINGAVLATDSVPINRVYGLQDALNNAAVELSSAVDGTRETVAATEKALKAAYDRANEAFQSASSGKNAVATAITGKGVPATGSDTFAQLSTKIGQIITGVPFAEGSGATDSNFLTVRGLAFRPKLIFLSVLSIKPNDSSTIWNSGYRIYSEYGNVGGYLNQMFKFVYGLIYDNEQPRPEHKDAFILYNDGFRVPFAVSSSGNVGLTYKFIALG